MVKPQELELFDQLSRSRLKDWLKDKISEDTKVLMMASDIDQLRKAQGRATAWQMMSDLLDAAPAALAKQRN